VEKDLDEILARHWKRVRWAAVDAGLDGAWEAVEWYDALEARKSRDDGGS
jgi:hypothetical protein